MGARTAVLLAAGVAGLLAAAVLGTGGGVADAGPVGCAGATPQVVEVSTDDDPQATSSGVVVHGYGRVEDRDEFVAWFEYRPVGYVEWRATDRKKVPTNSCGQAWFDATLTGLEANTTYEYRAVVSTGDDTARGSVKEFTTGNLTGANATPTATPSDQTPTRTDTPVPCPSFRGAALCTTTPTPTPHEDPPATPDSVSTPNEYDDARTVPPARDPGLSAWLAGVLPVLAWVGAVLLLAPLVLGGLVGVDALRERL